MKIYIPYYENRSWHTATLNSLECNLYKHKGGGYTIFAYNNAVAYNGDNVYVCISDTFSNGIVNMVNESFMKMIQARYGIKYAIINEPEDYLYLNWDGCDFMTVDGIQTFDADRKQFIQITEEQRILGGGKIENGNFYCVEAQQEGTNILERTFIPDSTMRFRRVI